jgi:peptide-methionine (S)-S-oxide reductase
MRVAGAFFPNSSSPPARTVVAAALWTLASSSSKTRTRAFSSNPSTVVGVLARRYCQGSSCLTSGIPTRSTFQTTTPLTDPWCNHCAGARRNGAGILTKRNLFGNFFRNFVGGGGAYDMKIDYTLLDHPGPELGQWAKNGIVPTHSLRDPELQVATFAGGCFWGMELALQRVPGVVYTTVGYTQGVPRVDDFPNYDQVCAGNTGHTEAVMVYYNGNECRYEDLLDCFFGRIDPVTVNGQGRDFGRQYRTGVYTHTPEQFDLTKAKMVVVQKNYTTRPLATECKAATPFWPAEKYHQQYLEKGGRFGTPQSAAKGATDEIRCYG